MSGWRKKQIADLQAGADIHAGDGGYRIGNAEDHAAFVAKRNKSIMHERIRELAIEAGAIHIHGKPKDRALVGYDNIEKFAELIVGECINTLEFHGFDDAVPYVKWMATNKLGVKE